MQQFAEIIEEISWIVCLEKSFKNPWITSRYNRSEKDTLKVIKEPGKTFQRLYGKTFSVSLQVNADRIFGTKFWKRNCIKFCRNFCTNIKKNLIEPQT